MRSNTSVHHSALGQDGTLPSAPVWVLRSDCGEEGMGACEAGDSIQAAQGAPQPSSASQSTAISPQPLPYLQRHQHNGQHGKQQLKD